MGHQCAIRVFDIDASGDGAQRSSISSHEHAESRFVQFRPAESKEPCSIFNPVGSKATVCTFALQKHLILTGHESGKVALFDVQTGEEVSNNEKAHMDTITDLQMSKDRTYFITSSKDKTARVSSCVGSWICDEEGLMSIQSQMHDTRTLRVLKTFPTETPLNSAAIAPVKPYVRFPPFYRPCT